MNLRQIEVFRAVMDAGSVSDAARLLHVSQPGVSRLVKHLELRLGVALFERRKGRLVATPEARALHAEVERVYRGVRQVQEVARQLRHGAQAPLRVLASANVSLQVVPRAIARLVAQQPQARVSFETLPPREIAGRLVAEDADIAFSSAALDHPALESREIGHWQLVCAIPADHRLAAAKALPLAEALAEKLVVYAPDAPQSAVLDAWLAEHGIERDAVVEVRSGYAACALAAAGAGIAFVDDLSARAHRTEGVVFRRIARAPRFPVYAASNVHRPLSAAGKALPGFVEDGLAALQRSRIDRDAPGGA